MRYQLVLQLPFNSKALEQLTAGYRDFDEADDYVPVYPTGCKRFSVK